MMHLIQKCLCYHFQIYIFVGHRYILYINGQSEMQKVVWWEFAVWYTATNRVCGEKCNHVFKWHLVHAYLCTSKNTMMQIYKENSIWLKQFWLLSRKINHEVDFFLLRLLLKQPMKSHCSTSPRVCKLGRREGKQNHRGKELSRPIRS